MEFLKKRNDGGNKILRQPLVPSEKTNVVRNHRTNKPPRLLPPNHRHPSPASTAPRPTLLPKRAQSADRRRHSSSTAPSTPVCNSTMVDLRLSSHRCGGGGGRTPDGPWPSMRSLTSAFQSKTISIPITKKDKSSVGITNSSENKRNLIEKKKKKKTATTTTTTALPDKQSKVVDHRRWPGVATVAPMTTINMPSPLSLTYIADVRRGKKTRNNIEEAHRLKVSYNRYLQWRFVNARSEDAIYIKKITMEDSVYNTWITMSALRDSVALKRVNIQRLNQALKLDSILVSQMSYLEDWSGLEREHSSSLTGGIEALKASTLRLPVTGGTKVDTQSLKDSINSAIDAMRFLGSSICSLLSKVEDTNSILSELSNLAFEETLLLDECRDLLTSTASMQVEESSLRTQLLQLNQDMVARSRPS